MDQFLINQRQPLRWWWFWLLCCFCMIAILCVLSLAGIPEFKMLSDKVLHAIAYCGFTLCWLQLWKGRYIEMFMVLFCVLVGTGLEFAQSFSPTRKMGFEDFMANVIGVLIGYVLAQLGLKNTLLNVEARLFKLFKSKHI